MTTAVTFSAATSAFAGAMLVLLSACSSTPVVDETSESTPSPASFSASASTQAELGITRWVITDTSDSSTLEALDADGQVKDRASFHWTETAEGRTVDIWLQGEHVEWRQRSSDLGVAEDGLDAFRSNVAAVAFATHASADLPAPSTGSVSPSMLRIQNDLVKGGPSESPLIIPPPEASPCDSTFHPAVQDCMKRMISIGLSQGLKSFCVGRCLAGS